MSTPEIGFEDLSPATHDDVRALILDGLREHWGTIDESLNPDLDDLLEAYTGGRTIVAHQDGTLVGTGTVRPLDRERAEILRMSVAPSARRSGLGARIVEELAATARRWGCTELVLETTSDWTDVVAFYERCGFTITHEEEGPFGADTWFEREL